MRGEQRDVTVLTVPVEEARAAGRKMAPTGERPEAEEGSSGCCHSAGRSCQNPRWRPDQGVRVKASFIL